MSEAARREFATRLLARRLALGMKQNSVGLRIAVSGNTVGKWERRVRWPTPALARAWAHAVGARDLEGVAEALFAAPPPVRAPCGTPRGYKQHLRRQQVCVECRAAWSEYVLALRVKRRERGGL